MRSVEVVTRGGVVVKRKPVLGDMRWDGQVWRRWSGRKWASAVAALHPERLREPTPFEHQAPIDPERRRRALDAAVDDQVSTNRASVVFAGRTGVVLAYLRPVSHGAHAFMTVITGGLWAIVWIPMAVSRRENRVRLEVDDWGNVWAVPVVGT